MVCTTIVCAVRVPLTIKLSAEEAVEEYNALSDSNEYDAVPAKDPVNPSVDIIEPELIRSPIILVDPEISNEYSGSILCKPTFPSY